MMIIMTMMMIKKRGREGGGEEDGWIPFTYIYIYNILFGYFWNSVMSEYPCHCL